MLRSYIARNRRLHRVYKYIQVLGFRKLWVSDAQAITPAEAGDAISLEGSSGPLLDMPDRSNASVIQPQPRTRRLALMAWRR